MEFRELRLESIVYCLGDIYMFAYIDAGTGSLLVQMLAGGAAGVFAFFKYRGLRLLGKSDESTEQPEPARTPE